ncbi:hypothetical protein HUO09_10110 [Vibrio sp. Y2-5]|uniref:hypothetical protein n=1 Tax=Vibrio sp. Y2-5 TaxID=2743977 RepID=UPI001660AC69|nr:hypothetical protein [Vibrio sp. Y2-5]MBD0786702.1 hypothetical protein [Vibrio sp. Y2-5]
MEVNSTLREVLVSMRRNALAAAIRNINVHVFSGKGSSKQLAEYVAGRLNVEPYIIRLWLSGEGVPAHYVKEMLVILNEHSVWGKHQIFPSERLAKAYMETPYA